MQIPEALSSSAEYDDSRAVVKVAGVDNGALAPGGALIIFFPPLLPPPSVDSAGNPSYRRGFFLGLVLDDLYGGSGTFRTSSSSLPRKLYSRRTNRSFLCAFCPFHPLRVIAKTSSQLGIISIRLGGEWA